MNEREEDLSEGASWREGAGDKGKGGRADLCGALCAIDSLSLPESHY